MFGAVQFLNVLILTLLCVRFVWFSKMAELPPVRERAADSACHLYFFLFVGMWLSIFPFDVGISFGF